MDLGGLSGNTVLFITSKEFGIILGPSELRFYYVHTR